jgi:hypothetical protein
MGLNQSTKIVFAANYVPAIGYFVLLLIINPSLFEFDIMLAMYF